MSVQVTDPVRIRLMDGSVREFQKGATLAEVAGSLSRSLGKNAVAAKWNGKLVDLSTPVQEDGEVEFVTLDDPEGLEVYRHTCAHVMAQAVSRLFPGTKFAIGPVIEDGFYYDFADHEFTPEDLPKIEQEMERVVKEDLPIRREVLGREEALAMFRDRDDRFKVEIIQDLPPDAVITVYHQGEFTDLCRGPHLPSTGRIKAFKLLSLAGAYWRGDSNREMLTRIYATAFPTQRQLDEYLRRVEEARKRDHRRVGRDLELFFFADEAPGMPFLLPKGMVIRNELERFMREFLNEYDYEEVKTPILMDRVLWERSGHWDHYKENMYFTEVDEREFALKPMNCPGHALTFKHRVRSYRDLPIRMAEFGLLHRHELSGALHGLLRVREFTQDDAHLFVRPDQIQDEVFACMDLIDRVYATFGFPYRVELSTRPENSTGSDELWEAATEGLRQALESRGLEYQINEGDGAFYGPKIDFHVKDSLGRSHQCGTIQLDFQMPEKFDLTYVGEDNERHRPVMIHRAVLGSFERFFGLLIEHYNGAFPVWLAPVQVRILTIGAGHLPYAKEVQSRARAMGLRVEVDGRAEKIGYKVREAQVQKIPYMLVIGDQEAQTGEVSVRKRGQGDLGRRSAEEILAAIAEEARTRTP
ncbi:threonine--tRNA ligase [Kyrpidia sp.]|uniref:threonine--tRNA ligase n=1 Tax=Kyrpidia sp. TaxID=2073077 RepID=UPI00258DBF43|nr:threonine--tRNA ligase [Kyrpidia sp.]MCL6574928.1 threonine--tRNA ligase [Kyrpidia sp.]